MSNSTLSLSTVQLLAKSSPSHLSVLIIAIPIPSLHYHRADSELFFGRQLN